MFLAKKRTVVLLLCSLLLFVLTAVHAQDSNAPAPPAKPPAQVPNSSLPDCVPSAPDGYKGNSCVVTIDRDNPASPPTLVVHGGTTVVVRIKNARWNENVSFTTTTTHVNNVDVAGTLLKSAINPLQGLVLAQQAHMARFAVVIDPIGNEQQQVLKSLSSVLRDLANASTELTCLETYKAVDTTAPSYRCDPATSLNADTFATAKTTAIAHMKAAAIEPLPLAQFKAIDAKVKIEVDNTLGLAENDPLRPAALQRGDKHLSNQAVLNSVINDAETTQKAMLETAAQLENLAGSPVESTYTISQAKNFNSTVTITAQEVLSKTSTTLAAVTVNWQSNHWEVSTGILFSTLKARSYTNAPLIVGGKPVLDSGGKTLTVVTETDTSPSIVFPLVMANYRLGFLSHAGWENKCPNHCSFLLSGGVGANLTSKTADFAAGPSFQIGGVLFTPTAHFGRENILTSGVVVGNQLGSSPPSLPTKYRWVIRFGFAVSYVLPFQ